MSPAKEVLEQIVAVHSYQVPLMVIIILVTVGLGIKSGLYRFIHGFRMPMAIQHRLPVRFYLHWYLKDIFSF